MGKLLYRILTAAFAIPIGALSRRLLIRAWRGTQGGEPPRDPQSPTARFTDVLAWAGLSALAVTAVRFLASRGAATTYRALTGRAAPGFGDPAGDGADTATGTGTGTGTGEGSTTRAG